MSDGADTGSGKHWTKALKDENAELRAEIEALRARFEEGAESTGSTPPIAVADEAALPPDDDEYHEAFDPLAWITDDVEEVHLISRNSSILRTPSGENAAIGKLGANAWRGAYLNALRTRVWLNCHIDYGAEGADEQDATSRRRANKRWHYFVVTKEDARMAFPEGHPKRDHRTQSEIDENVPTPGRAVVYPHEFQGMSERGVLKGKRRRCSGVKLRELTRLMLQTGAAGMTYFMTDIADYKTNPHIDKNKPNPYEHSMGRTVVGQRVVGGKVA